MRFSLSSRALLRGMLAGAVVLTGTACSRSDRTDSGRDNGRTVTGAVSDTATGAVSDTAGTSARPSSAQSNTPGAKTAPPSDKAAAGYRSMERDTTNIPSQPPDSASSIADETGDETADWQVVRPEDR